MGRPCRWSSPPHGCDRVAPGSPAPEAPLRHRKMSTERVPNTAPDVPRPGHTGSALPFPPEHPFGLGSVPDNRLEPDTPGVVPADGTFRKRFGVMEADAMPSSASGDRMAIGKHGFTEPNPPAGIVADLFWRRRRAFAWLPAGKLPNRMRLRHRRSVPIPLRGKQRGSLRPTGRRRLSGLWRAGQGVRSRTASYSDRLRAMSAILAVFAGPGRPEVEAARRLRTSGRGYRARCRDDGERAAARSVQGWRGLRSLRREAAGKRLSGRVDDCELRRLRRASGPRPPRPDRLATRRPAPA